MQNRELQFILKFRNEADRGLRQVSREFREAAEQADRFKRNISEAGSRSDASFRELVRNTKALLRDFEKLNISAGKVGAQLVAPYRSLGQAVRRAERPVENLNQEIRETARESRKAQTAIRAMGTGATRDFQSMGSQLRSFALQFAGIASAALAFREAVRVIGGFEESMAAVRAVTQANEEQMVSLVNQARELGATTQFSAREAAQGMEFLGRAGFTTNQILASTGGALRLAQSGNLELARAADISSNILKGFNLEASEMNRIVDVLADTARSANTDVEQLGQAMSFVAPFAQAMGRSLEETAAAAGVLSDAGIQATRAGTGLRAIISRLVRPLAGAEEALRNMGLSMEQVNPETHSLAEIFETLRDAGLDGGNAVRIFGQRTVSAALVLRDSVGRLKEFTTQLEGARGAATEMSHVMEDNLVGSFRAFRSAMEELILQSGDRGLSGALRGLLDTATDVLRVFNDMDDPLDETTESARELAKAIEGITGAVAALAALGFVKLLTRWGPAIAGVVARMNPWGAAFVTVAGGAAYFREELTALFSPQAEFENRMRESEKLVQSQADRLRELTPELIDLAEATDKTAKEQVDYRRTLIELTRAFPQYRNEILAAAGSVEELRFALEQLNRVSTIDQANVNLNSIVQQVKATRTEIDEAEAALERFRNAPIRAARVGSAATTFFRTEEERQKAIAETERKLEDLRLKYEGLNAERREAADFRNEALAQQAFVEATGITFDTYQGIINGIFGNLGKVSGRSKEELNALAQSLRELEAEFLPNVRKAEELRNALGRVDELIASGEFDSQRNTLLQLRAKIQEEINGLGKEEAKTQTEKLNPLREYLSGLRNQIALQEIANERGEDAAKIQEVVNNARAEGIRLTAGQVQAFAAQAADLLANIRRDARLDEFREALESQTEKLREQVEIEEYRKRLERENAQNIEGLITARQLLIDAGFRENELTEENRNKLREIVELQGQLNALKKEGDGPDIEEFREGARGIVEGLQEEITLLGRTAEERERLTLTTRLDTLAKNTNINATAEGVRVYQQFRQQVLDTYEALEQQKDEMIRAGLTTEEFVNQLQYSMRNVLFDLSDTQGQIEDVVSGSFKRLEDSIVEFAKTGKFEFSQLVDFILEETLRLTTKQTIIKPLLAGLESFVGSFGFGGGAAGAETAVSGVNIDASDFDFGFSAKKIAPEPVELSDILEFTSREGTFAGMVGERLRDADDSIAAFEFREREIDLSDYVKFGSVNVPEKEIDLPDIVRVRGERELSEKIRSGIEPPDVTVDPVLRDEYFLRDAKAFLSALREDETLRREIELRIRPKFEPPEAEPLDVPARLRFDDPGELDLTANAAIAVARPEPNRERFEFLPLIRDLGGRPARDGESGGRAGETRIEVRNNYTIDARGAERGTEDRIRSAIRESEERTKASIMESLNRGGAFAKATGRRN